jgi:hypothetical protein
MLSPALHVVIVRAFYASNGRLTASKARLRPFGGKDLQTNPLEQFTHFICKLL